MITPNDVLQIGLAALDVFGLYAVACFAGAGGGVLIAKTYLTSKIKAAVKHEYDEKLEILKADLADENNQNLEALKAQLAEKNNIQLEVLKAQLADTNNTQLEILKAQLKTQGDGAIERLKSDLTISAAQLNVEFAHLHTARAEVIASIHAELRDAIDMLADYTKPFEPVGGSTRQERGAKAAQAINAFIRTFRAKEIYLPETSADKLREIEEKLKFAFYRFFYRMDFVQAMGEDHTKQLIEIQEQVDKLSGPATKELQNDFRTLLGYRAPSQGLVKSD